MIDLCEFLEVAYGETTGKVIEHCGYYNGALSDFCLVLESNQEPYLKDWIRKNVRKNQEHCIKMLENDATATFKFLMRLRSMDECTSEFVREAGGIQQFLDKYNCMKSEVTEEAAVEPEVSEKDDTEPETTQEVASDSATEEVVSEEDTSEEPVQEELELVQETESESAQVIESEPIVKRHTIIEENTIHRTVEMIEDYNPALIEKISDGQIAESLEKLKELNAQIALGGLDTKMVLTDNDLSNLYAKLCTYPPDVFKAFILSYLKSVKSETERFRISSVMDDFLSFVRG